MLDKNGHFVEYFSYDRWLPITDVSFREKNEINFFVEYHTLYGSVDECEEWIKKFQERWCSKPTIVKEIEL